jgi:hypothetical protein
VVASLGAKHMGALHRELRAVVERTTA